MKHIFICAILLVLFCTSCKKTPQVNVVTYDLKKGDFTEKVYASGTIEAVNVICISSPRVYANELTVKKLVPNGTYVKKGDTVCILESKDLLEYNEMFSEQLKTAKSNLEKLEADNALNMSMLMAQVEKNEAQMSISQLDSIQMKFAPPAKQKILALELQKSKIERDKLKKKLEAQKSIDQSEIQQMKSRIIQNENRANMIADQIKSLTILAPRDGMIAPTETRTMMIMSSEGSGTFGGEVKEGSKLYSEMPIVNLPDLNEVQISVEVPENDYKRIEKDQRVSILVDAADKLTTTGVVRMKSMAGNMSSSETKIKTYKVIVSVDSCHLRMTPGLSAECEILIKQVKDTVVIPTLAIYVRDSLKTVYVYNGVDFKPVSIETGLSNSSETIVTKGLTGTE
ncbi:MAG: hypothetical protein PHY99_05615, partial [Bacteroidales bacterium]|nr:hypothetical protein [Bacteroidales bacterium]